MSGFQTWFTTYLAARLAPADVVATLATVPTPTSGRMLLINGNIVEWISYTWVSGSTITGLTRNLSTTADPVTWGTGLDWGAGSQILMVFMHDQIVDKESAFPIPGFTTVQRDALVMSSDYFTGTYAIIYNTTVGEYQYYNGVAWASFATGTVADASTTVAGKTKLSVAPVSSIIPIAVGDNDTRVPTVNTSTITANQVAALTGTGTPNGTTGKYVTNDDTGTSGANKVLRLDGSGNLPALNGSALTNINTGKYYNDNVAAGTVVTNATTTVLTQAIAANTFAVWYIGRFKWFLTGSGSPGAPTRTLTISYGGTTLATLTSATTGTTEAYEFELEMSVITATTALINFKQYVGTASTLNSVAARTVSNGTSFNFTIPTVASSQNLVLSITAGANGTMTYYSSYLEIIR